MEGEVKARESGTRTAYSLLKRQRFGEGLKMSRKKKRVKDRECNKMKEEVKKRMNR